jgi:hypothetical protein
MKLKGIKVPGFDEKDGKVSENRKAKLAKLPVNKRIIARANETNKVTVGSPRKASALPKLQRSDP